jgi:membrane-associated phospholipid phosphatase
MDGKRETGKTVTKRYLVAAFALIASFALDGPAREARGLVVKAIPKWLLRLLTHGGDLVTLAAVVGILLATGLIARRSRLGRAAVVLASALTATGLIVLSLKWLANRGEDGVFHGFWAGGQGIMFPSGHTAMAFAACAVIGAVWRKARWPACVIAAGVAVSRATLIHFLSDVVAGALIGVFVGQLVTAWAAKAGFLELDVDPRTAPLPDPGKPVPRA